MRIRVHSNAIVAVLGAALAMGLAVGSVSANRLSVSNRNFRITWTELMFTSGATSISCPLTLEGSFHYWTIAKVERALIGNISRASFGSASCPGGHATALQETLPWHVTYDGFRGVLPRITEIFLLFIGVAYLLEIGFSTSCLFLTTTEHPAIGTAKREAGGGISELNLSGRIPLLRGTFGCPNEQEFSGAGRLTLLGTTTAVTVRLI